MTTQIKRNKLAAAIASVAMGAIFAMPTSVHADDEFGSNTPYYEDDAWYDVSEWFDGNDYNPTDEAIGRWDDEVFTFAANATSSDNDNFLNWGDYGYAEDNDSDWFYDYYDDGYSYWNNNYYSSYYDTDDDGVYDSYASYNDTDGDGFYEDFNYYAFDSQSGNQEQSKQQAQGQQKQMKSTTVQVSGQVADTKMVSVRDRVHLVAMVKQLDGNPAMVDLGPNQSEVQLFQGDQLTAKGHVLKVGDKLVLLASQASMKNGDITIDRNGQKYQGTIEKTMTVKVRGIQHQLAKINTKNGKTMMVDMGPASNIDSDLSQGTQVTVQGVPVKVKDRVILMARQFSKDGNQTEIERQVASNR